jgi:Fe-S cluster biogenesis protein NfuA
VISREELSERSEFGELLEAMPSLEMVVVSPETFAVRGLPESLPEAVEVLNEQVREAHLWSSLGRPEQPEDDRRKLEAVLINEAPEILGSHKGTVRVKSYRDRVLALELGGKCAGCASAQITTQRELASRLYREVPLLDRITSDSSENP